MNLSDKGIFLTLRNQLNYSSRSSQNFYFFRNISFPGKIVSSAQEWYNKSIWDAIWDGDIILLGKAGPRMQSFDPTSSSQNGPWARNTSLQEMRIPKSHCWTRHLVWKYLSLCQTQHMLLCSAQVCTSCSTRPKPLPYPYLSGRGQFFWESTRTMPTGQMPALVGWMDRMAVGDLYILLKLILLCLFSMWVKHILGSAWLHVFSLETLMLRCSGHQTSDFRLLLLIIVNRYPLLNTCTPWDLICMGFLGCSFYGTCLSPPSNPFPKLFLNKSSLFFRTHLKKLLLDHHCVWDVHSLSCYRTWFLPQLQQAHVQLG